jgi:hypothetical protein
MVIRFNSKTSANEPLISLDSVIGQQTRELSAVFASSSQQFLECLKALVQTVDGHIREAIGFRGPDNFNRFGSYPVTYVWQPKDTFDYPRFASAASITYEAWYAARRINDDVNSFDGSKLEPLVQLFKKIGSGSSMPAGSVAYAEIPTLFLPFQAEVVRLEVLLSLKSPKEETPSQESSPLGSTALLEVADSVETTVSTPALKLEQHSDRETDWCTSYFTVSELTQMRKNVKLPHSPTQMTREIRKEIKNGRILRQGNQPMRLRMDLYKEWSTHGNE